ncbi:unnamed protein product [Prunus armeniaca]|uniref:Calcineurin-like phosphoesterase domain-containing protein n=1 Tax=Prunus armeniaca TaxID=36596 RepID=A0A6J5VEI3_PRUAR|nr:unnamed protein product [Prunus armeniaca]
MMGRLLLLLISPYLYSLLISTVALPTKPEGYHQLRPGAPFKIALFADLHFGEAESTDWGPLQDVNSTRVMSSVLDDENPDFVIYLGDVITANNVAIRNASLYWDQAVSPTRAKGIPWASVFGNHDDAAFEWPIEWFSPPGIPKIHCPVANSSCSGEEDCSFKGTQRLELMKNEIELNALSYSQFGPKELWPSVSNYVLQVFSSENPKSPVAFLYFLDSGGGSYPEVISSTQAEWFRKKALEINPDSRVPEIIFWHIPSCAYKKVAPLFGIHKPCVGSINKEKVATQEAETGIMKLLVERVSAKVRVTLDSNGGIVGKEKTKKNRIFSQLFVVIPCPICALLGTKKIPKSLTLDIAKLDRDIQVTLTECALVVKTSG